MNIYPRTREPDTSHRRWYSTYYNSGRLGRQFQTGVHARK